MSRRRCEATGAVVLRRDCLRAGRGADRRLRRRPRRRSAAPAPPAPGLVLPGFWDPRRRPERPDLTRIQTIRFLTDVDYPPFDYIGPDGNPAGFNVDLARLICDEIKISCTIQARSFDASA